MSEVRLDSVEQGFTLMEAGVVVIICGVLAAIAIPVFLGQDKKSREAALKSYTYGNNLDRFMAQKYASRAVELCTGSADLRADGFVRTTPDASDGKYNIINALSTLAATHQVVIHNPERTELDNGESHNWYIAKLPNQQEVFVNHDDLVTDNFVCDSPATGTDALGTVQVTR